MQSHDCAAQASGAFGGPPLFRPNPQHPVVHTSPIFLNPPPKPSAPAFRPNPHPQPAVPAFAPALHPTLTPTQTSDPTLRPNPLPSAFCRNPHPNLPPQLSSPSQPSSSSQHFCLTSAQALPPQPSAPTLSGSSCLPCVFFLMLKAPAPLCRHFYALLYKACHQSMVKVFRAIPASKRSSRGRPYFAWKSSASRPRHRAASRMHARLSNDELALATS